MFFEDLKALTGRCRLMMTTSRSASASGLVLSDNAICSRKAGSRGLSAKTATGRGEPHEFGQVDLVCGEDLVGSLPTSDGRLLREICIVARSVSVA